MPASQDVYTMSEPHHVGGAPSSPAIDLATYNRMMLDHTRRLMEMTNLPASSSPVGAQGRTTSASSADSNQQS